MEFFSTTFCGAKITKGGAPPKTVERSCELDLEDPTNRTGISVPENDLGSKLELPLTGVDELRDFIFYLYADILHDMKRNDRIKGDFKNSVTNINNDDNSSIIHKIAE